MNVVKVAEEWLKETGLPYSFDDGGHHIKIKLAGRMVGILPQTGRMKGRGHKTLMNTRAQIRRAAAEIRAERAMATPIKAEQGSVH